MTQGWESLVLHQPVDVMLGTMVTSWHLKNICYAQQGLLCVPVCDNLDRKGEETEMATAVFLLTYSNIFHVEQKVSNRQRTGMIHSSATTTPSLCAHTPKQSTFASGLQCSEETGRWAESTVEKRMLWPSSARINGSGSTRSSTPHPQCCRFQQTEGVSQKISFCFVCWV